MRCEGGVAPGFSWSPKSIAKKANGDGMVWFAYPKGTSKKYKSEINRDNGWQILGELGFEGVRGVAIDEDWSALRFRRVEFIKAMNRDKKRAMITQGKARLVFWWRAHADPSPTNDADQRRKSPAEKLDQRGQSSSRGLGWTAPTWMRKIDSTYMRTAVSSGALTTAKSGF